MPRHNPATQLPDATHEAYVLARSQGMGPTEAAAKVGLDNFRVVERKASFRDRLQLLQMSADGPVDPKLTLEFLVVERKRALARALASNQLKIADQHLSKLEELYAKHAELRGDVAKKEAPASAAQQTREERRAAHRAELSVVTEAAANE